MPKRRPGRPFRTAPVAGWLFALLLPCSIVTSTPVRADAPCETTVAEATSVQGLVEVRRSGSSQWARVTLGSAVCAGDSLRTAERSRAALMLANQTVLRLDARTSVSFSRIERDEPSWLELLKGALHFISRTPSSLEVRTPFVNAAIEGTEFAIDVGASATGIVVFEGRVGFDNPLGRLTLGTGEGAEALQGVAPRRRVVVNPREGVQWTLFYPAVLDFQALDPARLPSAEALAGAVRAYRDQELNTAFSLLDRVPVPEQGEAFFLLRASLLLSVGQVGEARPDIENALRLNPDSGGARALKSVILMAANRYDEALAAAQDAVRLDAGSAGAQLALSYAWQSQFDLHAARDAAEDAVTLASDDALAWARLGETELALGYLDRGLAAARRAATLDPALARAQTLLGFALLTRVRIADAMDTFDVAIALDPADPLPRLGLGLATIRKGDLDDGVREIEIAASLDPGSSLVRSYLGKGYFEQRRTEDARTEFEVARNLDPNDPTPWLYDAILKQTVNRPVEALGDLQRSIELNDRRAVYRSRLLLDRDRAARGASLARIFDDLGFEQRGLLESTRSLATDPGNASAHRFLSDTYAGIPRHGIAQVSELLQSQLLQSVNTTPVQPRLSVRAATPVTGAGPARLAFNEFTPLFERNRPRLTLAGVGGSNDTLGDEVVLSGLYNRVSYSLGQFHFQTSGFREDADVRSDIYNAYLQAALTPELNLQFEYRHRKTDQGDVRLRLDPLFSPSRDGNLNQDMARIGGRWSPSPSSDLIASFIWSDRDESIRQAALDTVVQTSDDRSGYEAEGQYLFRHPGINLVAGGGLWRVDGTRRSSIEGGAPPPPPPSFPAPGGPLAVPAVPPPPLLSRARIDSPPQQFDIDGENVYTYLNLRYPDRFGWTLGFSYDAYRQTAPEFSVRNVYPKFGVRWDIHDRVALRAAWFRTLKRLLAVDQTIEPTQVAGFNQFYDDPNGTEATQTGAAVDAQFARSWFGGIEFTRRELSQPDEISGGTGAAFRRTDRTEELYRAYLYWAPATQWALRASYLYEVDELDAFDLDTHQVPLEIRYFHPSGLLGFLGSTFVWQRQTGGGESLETSFPVIDLGLGYRSPKRRGHIGLEVRNLLDRDFRFQDSSFKQSDQFNIVHTFEPGRTVLLSAGINF